MWSQPPRDYQASSRRPVFGRVSCIRATAESHGEKRLFELSKLPAIDGACVKAGKEPLPERDWGARALELADKRSSLDPQAQDLRAYGAVEARGVGRKTRPHAAPRAIFAQGRDSRAPLEASLPGVSAIPGEKPGVLAEPREWSVVARDSPPRGESAGHRRECPTRSRRLVGLIMAGNVRDALMLSGLEHDWAGGLRPGDSGLARTSSCVRPFRAGVHAVDGRKRGEGGRRRSRSLGGGRD